MGSVKVDIDKGRYLYDLFDYSKPASVKAALKNLMKLELRAQMGDVTSQAIMVDLKTSLGHYHIDAILRGPVLTEKQREAIILHLIDDMPIQQVGATLGVDETSISHRVRSGLRRIAGFLKTGKISYKEWTKDEEKFLLENYTARGGKFCAAELGRPIDHIHAKISRLRKAG